MSMAPAFLLVAVTGGMHMVGGVEKETRAPIELPAGTIIDLKSSTAEADIRALLKSANIDHDFEYLRNRGTTAQTRPTSRPYINFKQQDGQWVVVGLLSKAYRRQTIGAVSVGTLLYLVLIFLA